MLRKEPVKKNTVVIETLPRHLSMLSLKNSILFTTASFIFSCSEVSEDHCSITQHSELSFSSTQNVTVSKKKIKYYRQKAIEIVDVLYKNKFDSLKTEHLKLQEKISNLEFKIVDMDLLPYYSLEHTYFRHLLEDFKNQLFVLNNNIKDLERKRMKSVIQFTKSFNQIITCNKPEMLDRLISTLEQNIKQHRHKELIQEWYDAEYRLYEEDLIRTLVEEKVSELNYDVFGTIRNIFFYLLSCIK